MKPIRMSWLPAPVVDEDDEEDEEEAPLMLELHASSSPPPPTTAALAPAARSRPRRLNSAGRGDDPPRPPRSWGDPSPQTPLASGCAVWSLICNRSPLRSRRGRGTASELTPCNPCGNWLRVLRRHEANIT